MIEEWLPNATNAHCSGANIVAHNQMLWDENVLPFLDMTVWGWLWCTRLRLPSHQISHQWICLLLDFV
eukprot:COSAG04_NODE_28_length_36566_cov_70.886665_22_plen_68_part_00